MQLRSIRFAVLSATIACVSASFAACADDSDEPADAGNSDAALADASGLDVTTSNDSSTSDVKAEAAIDATTDADPTDAGLDATIDAADAADASDAAPIGRALRFDGVDDIVTMAGDPSETAFTAELWFKAGPLGDAGYLTRGTMFSVWVTSSGGADRFLFLDDGKACFYVYNPGRANPKLCSPTTFNDGAWHHIAGTLGSTNGMRLYVDGQMVMSDALTTTSSFSGGNAFRFGYGHYGFSSPLVYFKGDIDEVRVWQAERTDAQILANYNKSVPTDSAGLQGYWKLDETGVGATAVDAVTSDAAAPHDGILDNFVLDGGAPSPWVTPGAF